MIISLNPSFFNFRITCSIAGFPNIGTKALGVLLVKGFSRVPNPAAKIIAFIKCIVKVSLGVLLLVDIELNSGLSFLKCLL